jgi:2-polyprenyl-3-methyl-5-hydroxy-6-metoxy-1,4-benzoquinol methylase
LFLARKGFDVTAMDLSSNAIEVLQKTATKQKLDQKIRAIVHNVNWPAQALATPTLA